MDVFHHDVATAVMGAGIVNTDDVLVLHPGDDRCLAFEGGDKL